MHQQALGYWLCAVKQVMLHHCSSYFGMESAPLQNDLIFSGLVLLSSSPLTWMEWWLLSCDTRRIFFTNKVTTLARNFTWLMTPSLSPDRPAIQGMWAMDTWVNVISPRGTEDVWGKPVGEETSHLIFQVLCSVLGGFGLIQRRKKRIDFLSEIITWPI